ncbi:hypothetical protein [Tumebacillus avium]|nr:hypothetical protein [Tumebacillus avium]
MKKIAFGAVAIALLISISFAHAETEIAEFRPPGPSIASTVE